MPSIFEKFSAVPGRSNKNWSDHPIQYDVLSSDHDASPTSSTSSCGLSSDSSTDEDNRAPSRWDKMYCLQATAVSTLLLLLGGLIVFLCRDYLKMLLLWLENVDLRVTAVIFIALFIAVSFPMVWGYILLNVAGGYLYGLLIGTGLTCGCALLGIIVAHIGTKRCLYEYVTSKISTNQNFSQLKAILRVVESDRGFKVVVLARLTPIPFGLQNGLFAISKIGLLRYLSASVIGLLPTQVLNAYIGTTLRSMEEVLTDSSNTLTAYVVFFSQLLLTAALSAYIIRRARIELNRTMEELGSGGGGHHGNGLMKHDPNMNGLLVRSDQPLSSDCSAYGEKPGTHQMLNHHASSSPLTTPAAYAYNVELVNESRGSR